LGEYATEWRAVPVFISRKKRGKEKTASANDEKSGREGKVVGRKTPHPYTDKKKLL